MKARMAVPLLVAVIAASVAAQPAPSVLDAHARARQLVDRAVTAHGGLDALRSLRQVRIVREGYDLWRHQSRAVTAPYDREAFFSDMHIDLANGRLVAEERRTYPGGVRRHFSFVTCGDQSYYVDHRRRTYVEDDYPPADTQTGNLFGLPQLVLLAAHESDLRMLALGTVRLAGGARVAAVTTTTAGNSLTIGLDPETYLLRAVLGVRVDAVEGVSETETEFLAYRMVDGLLMPERRIDRVAGEITQETTFTKVVRSYHVPDDLIRPPSRYARVPLVETPAVRGLAPGVWLIGGDQASLVVAMDDYLIVIDAAPRLAGRVVTEAARLAPGKPIRYVVPTHHHDDHAPGLGTLAADGAAVVTTAGNKTMFERWSNAPVEIVTDSRSWSSASRTLQVHDIGTGPHATEMLIAWLPADGILFQADLIDVGADGLIHPGANNDTTVHFAQWLAKRAWPVRTYVGAHGGVLDAAGFRQLLTQPVMPPPR